jgi:phage shock protein C
MKKLYLSETDKKISGVCGGIAETFDIDSVIVRLLVIFVAILTAVVPVVITYIIAALIIPKKPIHGAVQN